PMPIGLTPSPGSAWSWPTPRTSTPSPTFFLRNRFLGRGNRPWFSHCHPKPAPAMRAEDSSMAAMSLDEQAIFEVARKIDSREAREAYMQQVCGDDAAIGQRVRVLLKAYEASASFL